MAGQGTADSTATFAIEPCRTGMVNGRVVPPESETDCVALGKSALIEGETKPLHRSRATTNYCH